MTAIILSIGDELVLGQTVDTNSAWLSQQLATIGCDVVAHITVSDDQRGIEQAILESVGRCDFLLISGGIGPTPDDLTRQALATVMNVPLELDARWLERLQAFFTRLGRPMPESNQIQAMLPRDTTIIDNPNGTACGIDAHYISGDQITRCRILVMPGVPKEMKAMFAASVLPIIAQSDAASCILSRTLHTFGLGESWVSEKLGSLMERGRNPSVGTTVSGGMVSIRINARFGREQAQRELDATTQACRDALGDIIFGEDDDTLPSVVAQMLTSSRTTVATAESCTGGLLAKMLTDIPGSSAYFTHGWVTYANEAKILLGVPKELIDQYGAVSEQVAATLALAAAVQGKSDYALAISGIAGPTGGTPEKPVGTVCIALAHAQNTPARTFRFPGDREMIRDRSAKMALTMLRFHLLGKPMPF
jgi:nicotinamide-nucleotide amidase